MPEPMYQGGGVKLYLGDCLDILPKIPDRSVHLAVTSPPYNLGVDYGDGVSDSRDDYTEWIADVLSEIYRTLIRGGRLCLNLPAHTSKTLGGFEVLDVPRVARGIGFTLRATHIWFKPNHVGGTAWGSWLSPSCPTSLPNHEYIFVFDTAYKRTDRRGHGDATKEEFVQFVKTVWSFSPAIKINQHGENTLGHNAPFPEELPYRCMKLHSWPGDIVLDPFIGSGTTAVTAAKLERGCIGVEIDPPSLDGAVQRVDRVLSELRGLPPDKGGGKPLDDLPLFANSTP